METILTLDPIGSVFSAAEIILNPVQPGMASRYQPGLGNALRHRNATHPYLNSFRAFRAFRAFRVFRG
jgi:hypothetical protein